ncbi:MAG: hypothetical protein RLZZ59_271 [Pseudomonadota bacterium]|jgi:flagellar biosynthesis chaperone FliJ
MKKLQTLIKLHKNDVDKTLKQISEYNHMISQNEAELVKLMQDMQIEMEGFHASEYGPILDSYLLNSRKIQSVIQKNIKDLEQKVERAHLLLHEQFAELKKYEIALKNRILEFKEEEKRKETKKLDEHNVIRYVIPGSEIK